jgi:putative transposase
MKILRLSYPLPLLCRVLKASRSGYYAWSRRTPSKRALEEKRLALEIRAAHKRNRETCGPERLQKDLAENGVTVGIHRIRKIRKKLGIRCKQTRKFKATTHSKHTLPLAENLLEQNFEASLPNQVWVSDITYVATREGWLYCAAHKDLFNGEIVGYALGERITKDLVVSSLLMAIQRKQPNPGLIHHSDRGSQYCSYEFTKLLNLFKIRASMSRSEVSCF